MEQLCGIHIVLRPLMYAYIPEYLTAFTHEVRTALHVPDIDAEQNYLHNRLSLMQNGKTFFYCIFNQLQRLIGAIEIRGQEHPGQLYTWLHPDHWGKNYFQEALQLVQHIYFQHTHAPYFTARVDIDNKRSYKALKKAGFADYAIVQGCYAPQYELLFIHDPHFL